jgi:hypothetical protein
MSTIATQIFVVPFLVASFLNTAGAEDISIQCPTEGLFDGPAELAPQMPNPSAGWRLFFEGTPQRIELSPPRNPQGFWLIACYLDFGGGGVEISAHIRGTRKCQLSPNGGVVTPLQDGRQSCLIGTSDAEALRDRCVVICR